jgi:hypothetical protein
MKKSIAFAVFAASVVFSGCANMTGSGWTVLIDGASGLDNWTRVGDANWRVQDGLIVADSGKGGFLVSKQTYRNFEIRAEFWAAPDTNSGIYIRCADPAKIGADSCYEINIWDIRPELKYATGAIVDLASVIVPLQVTAGGRWNTFEIWVKDTAITVKLNGVVTSQSNAATKFSSGPFALQYGAGVQGAQGGPIKWKKVEIRSL